MNNRGHHGTTSVGLRLLVDSQGEVSDMEAFGNHFVVVDRHKVKMAASMLSVRVTSRYTLFSNTCARRVHRYLFQTLHRTSPGLQTVLFSSDVVATGYEINVAVY